MAVSPIGGSIGSIVPPGVSPDAAEVLRLRMQLDLLHAQLMSSLRPTRQRMVQLLNAYLDAVRQLHGAGTPLPKFTQTAGATAAAPSVCYIPAPPAPPVPIPYPNVAASSATKTPTTKQAQRSKIELTHQQIKSST
jgi:hypothetical protein